MAFYRATIDVLLQCDSEAEACDAVTEALWPLLKTCADEPSETAWIDWKYAGAPVPTHPVAITSDEAREFEFGESVGA